MQLYIVNGDRRVTRCFNFVKELRSGDLPAGELPTKQNQIILKRGLTLSMELFFRRGLARWISNPLFKQFAICPLGTWS